MLLTGISHTTLDVRFGQSKCVLYVSPRILIQITLQFARLLLDRHANALGMMEMARVSYYLGCLHIIRPKVILDFIHIPAVFHYAKYYAAAEYFVILNGFFSEVLDFEIDDGDMLNRYQYALARMKPRNVTNIRIFCFGEKDIEIFLDIGLATSVTGIRYHACGPLMADFYFNRRLNGKLPEEKFDICYSSQASSSYIVCRDDFDRVLMKSNELLTEYLLRFNETRKLQIAVAMRTEGDDSEKIVEAEYFRSRFKESEGFHLYPKSNYLSSYGIVASSRVILGLNSSIGFEATKWGKKVLFAPFYLRDIYRISSRRYMSDEDMWKWWIVGFSYEEFEVKLDRLLSYSQEKYVKEMAARAHAISNFGAPVPAHEFIRKAILTACEVK